MFITACESPSPSGLLLFVPFIIVIDTLEKYSFAHCLGNLWCDAAPCVSFPIPTGKKHLLLFFSAEMFLSHHRSLQCQFHSARFISATSMRRTFIVLALIPFAWVFSGVWDWLMNGLVRTHSTPFPLDSFLLQSIYSRSINSNCTHAPLSTSANIWTQTFIVGNIRGSS